MKSLNEKAAGTRLTLQKQAILDALQSNPKMMTAEEVYGRVREKYPNVSLGTVYRNLQSYSTRGQVRRTLLSDGKARFELAGNVHHHHLICLSCGETSEVPWCPVGLEVSAFMTECEFTPVSHQFEIYGYCRRCSASRHEGV
jgi:Fe2+ or Zn2+ uptake regulation protein